MGIELQIYSILNDVLFLCFFHLYVCDVMCDVCVCVGVCVCVIRWGWWRSLPPRLPTALCWANSWSTTQTLWSRPTEPLRNSLEKSSPM